VNIRTERFCHVIVAFQTLGVADEITVGLRGGCHAHHQESQQDKERELLLVLSAYHKASFQLIESILLFI
jgi:hypothetical protein